MAFIGVDGCKAGWIVCEITNEKILKFSLFPTILSLWDNYSDAIRILIDIPIGLIDRGSSYRECDILARKALSYPRCSSVFFPPCRNALYARTYEKANEINRKWTKKGLSKQAWNISNKIREVDMFLRQNLRANMILLESHPELCFWAFNDKKPMQMNKQTPQGFEERKNMLLFICDKLKIKVDISDVLIQFSKKDVQFDDLLDAWILALTAMQEPENLQSLPKNLSFDSQNIPMRIIYSNIFIHEKM